MKIIYELDFKKINGGKCTAPQAMLYGIVGATVEANPASVEWGIVNELVFCEWNNMDVAS